jgi:hypothetical protein
MTDAPNNNFEGTDRESRYAPGPSSQKKEEMYISIDNLHYPIYGDVNTL